jgi:uncharacterized protein with PQ loop repeat
MTELVGWCSSAILLLTIVQQVVRQWRERSRQQQSRWLFGGQTLASLGFTIYSYLLHNWVFTVTNALLLVSAAFGIALTFRSRNSAASAPLPRPAAP